jgi:hypothetical protein
VTVDVEGVRDPHDPNRVIFWRYTVPGARRHSGAVSPVAGKWRAIAYGESVPRDNVVLGIFATRDDADRAVRAHADLHARTPSAGTLAETA